MANGTLILDDLFTAALNFMRQRTKKFLQPFEQSKIAKIKVFFIAFTICFDSKNMSRAHDKRF